MTKILTVLMLMMFSLGASADVKVLYGEKGEEKFTGTGGTIEATSQTKPDANGQVTVTLTVTPDNGYTISMSDIEVYATISPSATRGETPEISSKLTLKGKDPSDLSQKRDYTVTLKSTLGLWIKKAEFVSGSKGPNRDVTVPSGLYYIASGGNNGTNNQIVYYGEKSTNNYYLCPTHEWYYYQSTSPYYLEHSDSPNNDNGMPFMTTYQCLNDDYYDSNKALWCIKKKEDTDYYYIIHVVSGKYLTYNAAYFSNDGRVRVHLEDYSSDKDDYALYKIEYVSQFNSYDIISKYAEDNNTYKYENRPRKYLNVNKGNRPSLVGTDADKTTPAYSGGIIGLWSYGAYYESNTNKNDQNSRWQPNSVLLTAPTINFIQEGNNFIVTIAESNNLPAGYTILYTTNGDDPAIDGETTSTYTTALPISYNCTVKAVVARYGIILTEIATQYVGSPDAPIITPSNDCTNVIEMSAAEGISIYYTLDGTNPDNNSTPYTEPFVLNEVATIEAIAYNGNIHSDITTHNFTSPYSVKPTITSNGATITITGTGSLYYTTDGTEPGIGSTPYTAPFTLTGSSGQVITVKAVAKDGNKGLSCVVEKSVTMARYVSKLADLEEISSHPNDIYILTDDIDAVGLSASISGFTGTFDGGYYTISGLKKPLFDNLNGATVKNVVLDPNGSINGNGAICNEAEGTTKIYNCGVLSGSVSGSGNVGGLVGQINSGSSVRVVNCYNFADVNGSAGIVGNNLSDNSRIALCMMYGNLTGGTSPVYAGTHTSNNKNFTEYNYWLYSTTDAHGKKVPKTFEYSVYNDQLAIDREEYLTRFPFYRHILNTHRELAAFFLFGESGETVNDITDDEVAEIGHWTLKRGDGAPKYPVLEEFISNTHRTTQDIINNLPNTSDDGKGKLLTQMGSSGYVTVNITINGSSYSKSLPITDMNEDLYDYTWGKIVLPFANEFSGWTRDYSKICTGWEITSLDVNKGSYANYDMADRDNTAKDLYSKNNYIFAQGGNYIVPYGVKTINIMAHFANAFYLSDPSYEIGYDAKFENPTQLGGSVSDTYHGQHVYTDLTTLVNALSNTTNPHVQAIVLVGNFHYMVKAANQVLLNTSKAVTIMSTDEDNNQEPDYGWYMGDTYGRLEWPAIRFDFVPIIELGMSSRVSNSSYYPGIGIWRTKGWFEQTETCVSFRSQCEINSVDFADIDDGKGNNRWIINSGYFTQIVRAKSDNCTKLSYIQIGGNAYVKELYPGSHTDAARTNTAVPINVTGGQVDECYMTGPKAGGKLSGPMIYFWCAGGKIGKFLGAYLEEPQEAGLKARVDHALVGRFFGGGTSTSARIKGDIDITINNSTVDFFCGGPEFGDMYPGKTVTTHATGTIFGEYYGAGFGGTSITYNREQQNNTVSLGAETEFPLSFTNYYKYLAKSADGYGIGTCYKFEYIYHSNGYQGVARFYTGYAQFSLATTGSVINVLNDCKIKVLPGTNSLTPKATTGYFYGAGCQGKVDGTVTSTLTNCEVQYSAFGGGYKAAANDVDVYPDGAAGKPEYSTYYKETGLFSDFGEKDPISPSYIWEQGDDDHDLVAGTGTNAGKLFTSKNIAMTDLGNVTGAISITIDGGSVGGNVFGGGNESKSLNNASVTIQNEAIIEGNVFGGGNEADVAGNTLVDMSGGTVSQNVFGGGKGSSENYECDKAMVGVNNAGAGADLTSDENKVKGTKVIITAGTVNGNVFGGGELGRVEWNTQVTIGTKDDTNESARPVISGNVFGAGAGLETHGYSALVRGNSTVTVQGKAKVLQNVYGGGEKATVGRYWVKGINDNVEGAPTAPGNLPTGMPYQQQSGGICTVIIQDNAQIGPDDGASDLAGHVFGAGKGINPHFVENGEGQSQKMVKGDAEHPDRLVGFTAENGKTAEQLYLEFLQTLALATNSNVTIDGSAKVKGSVMGGSENGFVQNDSHVTIQGSNCEIGTSTYGNVYGGGRGLLTFAEAGKVKGNTTVTVSAGAIKGNVYGGGSLGDVGIIDKTEKDNNGQLTYNYYWKKTDGSTANTAGNNGITYDENETNKNTGICTVTISGGTIGTSGTVSTDHGNVFGAGKGSETTWWCEKAIAYATSVTVSGGTVNGTVYGGGQVGRVEDDAKVVIGVANATGDTAPTITGSVFGAGAGLYTHGYSALVRGNSDVTVQGTAQVGGSVYGGGEIASVGRFTVVGGLPKHPDSGGTCTVTIQDNAKIGTSGTTHNVYGACKGVNPADVSERKSMQLYANRPKNANGTYKNEHDGWEFYEPNHDFVWVYYSEADYPAFLKTLALTSHPHVTVAEEATVYGSVFGGGQRGITLGRVDVDITGGNIEQDVYGGGALADTNCGNWDADSYTEVTGLVEGASVAGLYTRTGSGTTESPYVYTATTGENPTYDGSTTYYSKGKWHNLDQKTALYTTTVDLTGGLIKGDAYGGGLGQKTGFNSATSNIAAVVWGDISVNLGSSGGSSATAFEVNKYTDEGHVGIVKTGRVFGCNNLMGSPQGDVRVTVYKTVEGNTPRTTEEAKANNKALKEAHPDTYETEEGYVTPTYHVAAVYGGGNLADYTATGKKAYVRIETCYVSIRDVYGGGNAAEVPETDVLVRGAYEIQEVFGGGNGKDPYTNGTTWTENPGANIGNATNPGNATTLLTGGFVHEAYGGSNEKGTIFGSVAIDMGVGSSADHTNGACTLDVEKLVGAGKNADVNGDLIMIMGCKPSSKTPLLYAGADNANVKGNVELTITSGNYGKVFGGNNEGGAIFGHIKLNIEETGGCDTPITIDELYLGGNMAAYSVYGYYDDGTTMPGSTKPLYKPRTKADDEHQIVTFESLNPHTVPDETTHQYDNPVLNLISCTYIGKVFGGGYGTGAALYGDPIVNINMIQGSKADGVPTFMTTDDRLTALTLDANDNPNKLGVIGDVYGGGNAADIYGNTTVNIGMATEVWCHQSVDANGNYTMYPSLSDPGTPVLGAYITGNVFGGGNMAEVSGDTHVNICGTQESDSESENGYKDTAVSHSGTTNFNISIGNSVYGGGNAAHVLGNTFVTMADGYVFNGIFGGGLSGSVGTFTSWDKTVTIWNHNPSHEGTCIGKPTACKEGTGTCYVVVSGGQIGPLEVATLGMNRTTNGHGDPVPQGWVWGAGCGLVEDPSEEPDTHFKTYVNNTDVTIKGNAFILESIIGGGEFGRVLGNTLVKIEGGQIGVGAGQVDGNNKPVVYTAAQWTEAEAAVSAGDASRINTIAAAMPACSTFPYTSPYNTYDPYADLVTGTKPYPGGSTDNATDGKTWIGCVFAGGSGYMPYTKEDTDGNITDYDWVQSAGWVEGDAEVRISGGHILTNVYGGNEYTDVKGTCRVTMTGGTVGVPRTVDQILANPMIGHVFGAGKGDPRVHFNKVTNVKDVEVEITGGIVYGSVFGGGEDGHVLHNVTMTIGKTDKTGPTIGTWGTTYIDGYVFGGGRGYSGDAYTAGNVAGCVGVEIKGGNILGSVYGGGQLGSVGYGLFDALTNGSPTPGYGEMRADTDTEEGFSTEGFFSPNGRGHIELTISGGTIGNNYEYIMPQTGSGGNTPTTITETDFTKWSDTDWTIWKDYNYIPKTEFDTTTGRVSHTKGGNVFAGGMGRIYQLDDTTPISAVDWWKMGCVKSTKLTISGDAVIKSTVFGGGELGQVVGYHTAKNAADADVNVGTEVIINGGTIGTEIKESGDVTRFVYGSVFGGGYGSLVEKMTHTGNKPDSYPKYIAGRVKAGTKVKITDGTVVRASVYGGGKMAAVGESTVLAAQTDPVIPGETLTVGHTGDTHVIISGGTIGEAPLTLSDNSIRYFGGAKVGNVYGGGSGHNNTVRSGHVYGNTNVTISDGTIYHNVYGGGAYGSVGEFEYQTTDVSGAPKVSGIKGLSTDHDNTGVATVTITGGTIGVNGKENGMVFGSSRGDINKPEERDDHTAWVYDANVTIGDANGGPAIKGSVYGSGENGHTFNNAVVTVNKGTIGIAEGEDITYTENGQSVTKGGAAYPYRGNVYGGGCGTDKYYSNHEEETHDGNGQLFNPLAGIVYGNTTVNINGGTIVRNVYGAGAMGSVGKLNTDNNTITGGTTTINISGGTIGVSGTVGDGNVFGAARGDVDAISNEAALVRKATDVSITGGTIKGNVYGGGELGCVGTYTISPDYRTFTWQDTAGNTNTAANSGNKNTGICKVTVDGSSAVVNGKVFGAGKGKDDTFWCEKGIAYSTDVSITKGTVNGNVYGGGEVGRVETDTKVKIGDGAGTEGEASAPTIKGSVFGGGAGVETHGYSALVRGNTTVSVEGNAAVGHSVYGGGEIASVGKYGLDENKMPSILQGGGYCYVTVKGHAKITDDVFGAGEGVTPHFDNTNADLSKRSRRMTLKDGWEYLVGDERFEWDYLQSESAYSTYLETLALVTHPEVTIDGNAAVSGSVFGGGELGLTKGSVIVNIQGGTIAEDVYGGGKLANTNTTSLVDLDGDGNTETVHPTTTVKLYGGLIKGDAYGGGLGQKTGFYDANGAIATSDIEATVYGDITVNLGSIVTPATETKPAVLGPATAFNIHYEETGDKDEANNPIKVVQSGRVFGCNNLNGSPQGNVTVNVYKTVAGTLEGVPNTRTALENYKKKEGDAEYVAPTYELAAVYGGGNLADYTATDKKASVIIHTCDVSVQHVYGGGNAAAVPETDVLVKGAWEIEHVFGGGNGKDKYKRANEWIPNPGANVLTNTNTLLIGGYIHEAYGGSNESGTISGNVTINTDSKDARCVCDLELVKLYGAGKNADIDGDLIVVLDCAPETKTEEIYGGAENANVRGNVELTITSGSFGKVFGGNNQSGAIFGHIILNIEETSCRPIIIDELYGCGNNAAYSVYGYKEGTDADGYKIYVPRTSLDDGVAVTFNKDENQTAHTTPQYADPQVNIISCTSIGKVFGGGYGSGATVYGNPTVNINQIYGKAYDGNAYTATATTLGEIGEVFGGGNEANVVGNTTVNVGTVSTVQLHQSYDKTTGYSMSGNQTVIGANITGNVYGGGNQAEVTGNTNVNIGRSVTP